MADVTADDGYDLVAVGEKIKRGDEFLLDSGDWAVVPDKYLDKLVEKKTRPIRRRKRWDCWHLRDDYESYCPVCAAFLRFIDTRW